jgi:uncharacterized protein (DUF1778 family)
MGKSEWLKIRISPDEKRAFQQAADAAGISLSAWMRERLRRAAAAELEMMNVPIPFYPPRCQAAQ